MKAPFAVGCLLTVLYQTPNFGDVETISVIEQPSEFIVKGPVDVSKEGLAQQDAKEEASIPTALEMSRNVQAILSSVTEPLIANIEKQNLPPSTEKSNSHVHIGGSYTRASIRPNGNPSFQGNLAGVQGIYEYKPWDNIYVGVKLAGRQGNTHGSDGKRTLLDVDLQERIGYTFAFDSGRWLLSFFSGIGYRHLGQELKPFGDSAISFKYNELYVPVGFLTDHQINSYLTLGFHLTWMPQVYPTVTISPLKGARWIIDNTCANVLVEMPFVFKLPDTKYFTVTLNPFFEYWQDGHSTARTRTGVSLGLPGNTYLFWGADVNLSFAF